MSGSFPEEFADARPVAHHCAELTWRGPRPEERSETVASWCRDLGSEMAQELGQLFSGGKLRVAVAEPELVAGRQVFETIGPIALNSLLRCGDSEQTMLLSLDYATAIALTDASFGGSGLMPDKPPVELPRSAGMLVEQCASAIAQVIARSHGAPDHAFGDVLVRSESASRLKPFSDETEVACFEVIVTMGDQCAWRLLLAVANDRLDNLLPGTASERPASARLSSAPDVSKGAIAAMPLQIEAVLGEFEMSLERLEKLKPGDEIPLVAMRDLPLRMGEHIVAHGALGTLDNCFAIRVSSLPGARKAASFSPTHEVAA